MDSAVGQELVMSTNFKSFNMTSVNVPGQKNCKKKKMKRIEAIKKKQTNVRHTAKLL